MKLESEIKFHVSGVQYTVKPSDVSPETTLNEYLREKLHLTATKKMCLEGGCGVCVVAIEELDPHGNKKVFAVNSCLVSIFSCHGWKILSNEGIGGPSTGYHEIQKLLAENNGTQCGFCSSGMVMNMYALQQSGPKTKEEIEHSFGGNLCRCTGYRPILTAFKKLAVDADDKKIIPDLEDYKQCSGLGCRNDCLKSCKMPIYFESDSSRWVKVYTLKDLLEILITTKNTYMLVAGNTARGVYWPTSVPDIYIDITGVIELRSYTALDETLTLGGNITLTEAIAIFRRISKGNDKFAYTDKMADHLDLVAHIPVRNIGTIAGNLMIKHQHNEFPSDVFLILETVAATIIIVDTDENEIRATPQNFLKVDMTKKVIREIILHGYSKNYCYTSYKIMPRAQNAHALVNAGFLLKLDSQGTVNSARIVYGAINPSFIHAKKTEAVLIGKDLFDNTTLQTVFQSLDVELNPDWVLPDPNPKFRKQLAINLFYKYVLSIAPFSIVSARNQSGGTLLTRPVSGGTQEFNSNKYLYPLTQPITKVEALAQSSGRAKYILDIPDQPGQLHGILIPAQVPAGSVITGFDIEDALRSPGAVAFYSAKDIPGLNSIAVKNISQLVVEELFCSGTVHYYSQPVGVLVASSHNEALTASSLVRVKATTPSSNPLLTIQDVLTQSKTDRITHQTSVLPKRKGTDVKKVIKGQTSIRGQYHFHMETQNCVVIPTEDGLDIHAGTQWMDHIQGVVSQVLKIPSQKINIFVRRLGGGFGAKLSRNAFVAGAAALAASKLDKPMRIWMTFSDNMDIIGKRYPLLADYEVGVNAIGVIQYLKANLYSDFGIGGNEPIDSLLISQFQNCYLVDTWTFDTYIVRTDNHAQCFTRAPGTLEGLAAIESIMDHIAHSLSLDPLDVRKVNMNVKNNPILVGFLDDMIHTDDLDKRKAYINAYNSANRWKKKGLSLVPMRWTLEVLANFTTLVSIYHLDGGVAVSHGGIEMGQGINTKGVPNSSLIIGISETIRDTASVKLLQSCGNLCPLICFRDPHDEARIWDTLHIVREVCEELFEEVYIAITLEVIFKVIQVCAYKFGIPLDKISVTPNYNVASPNSASSGGSLTSEAVVYALLKACDILLARIKPIREKNPKATWEELIQLCYSANVQLTTNGFYSNDSPGIQEYPIFAWCALELEVDVLTGKHEISRVDVLEDVGQSMSPLIDIGQLEGGLVMGLGYFSSEELVYDSNGRLLTNRTWTWKPPGARDIPVDFRVRFSNNTPNPVGVLKSKAIAEPPTCLSIALPLALRLALASARRDASATASTWYPINGSSTVENTLLNALNDYTQYTL